MLKRLWTRWFSPRATELEAMDVVTDEELVSPPVGYSSDRPNPLKDALNRRPFAERIAATIAERRDRQSIVIGIYGKWGEGKSTVLATIVNDDECCSSNMYSGSVKDEGPGVDKRVSKLRQVAP